MRYLDYWWLWVRQAWDDTMAAFGWTRRHPIIVVVVFIVTILVLSDIDDNPRALGEVVKAIAKATAILLIFPVVFVFDLFVIAPYRLYQKEHAAANVARDALAERQRPRLQFDFLEDCCADRAGVIAAGVRSDAVTVRNVAVRLDIPQLGVLQRGLAWHGTVAPIQIDPAPIPEFHHHFDIAHVYNVVPGRRALEFYAAHPAARQLPPGEYHIRLSATGEDVSATVVEAIVKMGADESLSLVPIREAGKIGWIQRS